MTDSPEDPTQQRYAERLFPPPVDHGIALPDRAVASVKSGTDTVRYNDPQGKWYEGGGRIGEKAVESIVVYPPSRGLVSQGDPFEPVKIGILVDMDIGQLLSDWVDATILAVEDALNEGVYDRPVEIRTVDARGLPRENYTKVLAGCQKLVDDGCVVVLGPMISDNSVALRDLVNKTGVACIGGTGAVRFNGEYCFTVTNGDIPYDHRGYKGDFLTIRELRGGELHFRGYYRPQWPSNTESPLLAVGAADEVKGSDPA